MSPFLGNTGKHRGTRFPNARDVLPQKRGAFGCPPEKGDFWGAPHNFYPIKLKKEAKIRKQRQYINKTYLTFIFIYLEQSCEFTFE
jgi:hypothetical protein